MPVISGACSCTKLATCLWTGAQGTRSRVVRTLVILTTRMPFIPDKCEIHVSNSWWTVQWGSSPMRWDLREVLPPLIANHLIKKILSSLNNAYAQLATEKVEDDFENKFSPLEIWTSYSLAPSESEIQILYRLSQSVPVRPVKGWSKQWWDLFVNSEFGVIYGP